MPWQFTSPSRLYLLLLLCTAVFTIYGSWVPFRFQYRPLSETWDAYLWVWEHRLAVQSRSDALVNVLLGVPLGFSALGCVRGERVPGWRDLTAAVLLWPGCVTFAAAVEFSQLYFHGRTSSATDVVAQALGSGLGMLAWLTCGRMMLHTVLTWERGTHKADVGRMILLYVGFLFAVQLLPWDFDTGIVSILRRMKHDPAEGAFFVWPAIAWARSDQGALARLQNLVELGLLFLPLGLLLSQLGRRRSVHALTVVGCGIGLPWLTELAQFSVSRRADLWDVVAGAVGIWAGWLAAQCYHAKSTRFCLVGLTAAWLLLMLFIHWQPFGLQPWCGSNIIWVPFSDLAMSSSSLGLSAVIERLASFLPLGVLLASTTIAYRDDQRTKLRSSLVLIVGFSVACVLEIGQGFIPARTPGATELCLGPLGTWLGARATILLQTGAKSLTLGDDTSA